jgi:hypothetical protein
VCLADSTHPTTANELAVAPAGAGGDGALDEHVIDVRWPAAENALRRPIPVVQRELAPFQKHLARQSTSSRCGFDACRMLCLSGDTPGDREGLAFRRVRVHARLRIIPHARLDSLRYSVAFFI